MPSSAARREQSRPSLRELQHRVRRMEGGGVGADLELLPALGSVLSLRTGTSCCVDSPGLALALAAGPSQAGAWVGVVGLADLGWEAAAAFGLDLERTVSVPFPGEHWLSVTAGLIEVATVVLVRPPGRVGEAQAARIAARMRQRGAALVVEGDWPRSAARLTTLEHRWGGLGRGHGHLDRHLVTVGVRLGAAPVREVTLSMPTGDQPVVLWPEVVEPGGAQASLDQVLAG